jgi:hypothetical protein
MSLGKKSILIISVFFLLSITLYFLFFKKTILTPSICFNKSDREILIVSDKKCELDTILVGPSTNFFNQIYNKIDYNQVFISLIKPKILFNFRSDISDKKIETLLNLLGYKFHKLENGYKLENNWKCIFNDSNLFFFKGDFKSNESGFILKKNKHDFSIYNTLEKKITNYRITQNNLIKTYSNKFKKSFINKNDFKLFSNMIPNRIEGYTFFEKKFAENNLVIEKGTSFYEILKDGFCIFKYKGNEFILANSKNNKDPYQILDKESGIEEIVPGLRKRYQNIFLTSETPRLNNFFYVDFIKNKLLFCQSKVLYEEILNLINEKKSLKINKNDFDFLFNHHPKSVIFRTVNRNEKKAICSKENYLQELVSRKFINDKINVKTYNSIENVQHIIGGNGNLYVFTNNELIKLSNDEIIERVKYRGQIIGKPHFINSEKGGGIYFTTSEKLYFLDPHFRAINGYPILLKHKPKIPFDFSNLSSDLLVGYSEKNILSICDSKGNVKEKLDLILGDVKSPISFFNSNNLNGVLYDNNIAQFIDFESEKLLNKVSLKFQNTVFLTTDSYQAFYYLHNNKLIRNDFNGDLKICATGQKLFNLKTFSEVQVIGVLSNKNLAVFDAEGECISKILLPTNRISDYLVIKNEEETKYVILFDDLSNDIYIYTFEGEIVLKSPIKGNKTIYINGIGRDLQIHTVYNNKLIKYLK